MCFSFQSSINAWFLAMIPAVYMLMRNDIYDNWIPLLILVIAQIQIMEALIWVSIKNKDDRTNEYVTRILCYLLWSQPLMNSVIGYFNTKETVLIYFIFVYTLANLYNYYTSKSDNFESFVGQGGHLVWNREKQATILGNGFMIILYMIGLLVPLFWLKNKAMSSITIGFAIVTFLYAQMSFKEAMGSIWCYTAVLLSFISLFFNTKNSI